MNKRFTFIGLGLFLLMATANLTPSKEPARSKLSPVKSETSDCCYPSYANAVRCFPGQASFYSTACNDCSFGTPYCGKDWCSVFGCDCLGGCREQPPPTPITRNRLETIEGDTIYSIPLSVVSINQTQYELPAGLHADLIQLTHSAPGTRHFEIPVAQAVRLLKNRTNLRIFANLTNLDMFKVIERTNTTTTTVRPRSKGHVTKIANTSQSDTKKNESSSPLAAATMDDISYQFY